MAQVFNVNQPHAAAQYVGQAFFNLKQLAVSAGYFVRGSGDGGTRYAFDGATAALPLAEQATNPWDCWQSGNVRTDASSVVAGDAGNVRAWCVLEDGAGRQILLQASAGTVGWNGYGNVAVARAGSGGFTSGTASATSAPGAPTAGAGSEFFFFGTRNGNGGIVLNTTNDSTIHMWADTTPGVDGGLALGWFSVLNLTLAPSTHWSVAPIAADASSADSDPAVYLSSAADRGWDWAAGPTYTLRALNSPDASAFWRNNGTPDPITGDFAIAAPLWVTGTNECAKGTVHPTSLRMMPISRPYGYYGLDQNGLGWCTGPGPNQYCFPWPDTLPVPGP